MGIDNTYEDLTLDDVSAQERQEIKAFLPFKESFFVDDLLGTELGEFNMYDTLSAYLFSQTWGRLANKCLDTKAPRKYWAMTILEQEGLITSHLDIESDREGSFVVVTIEWSGE